MRKEVEQITVSSTQAQNEFGRLLDSTRKDREVMITRHGIPRAVLMSVDRYNMLVAAEGAGLDTLTEEFDALLARMQTPAARAGVRRAFAASPRELGKAATSLPHHRRREG